MHKQYIYLFILAAATLCARLHGADEKKLPTIKIPRFCSKRFYSELKSLPISGDSAKIKIVIDSKGRWHPQILKPEEQ